MSCCKTPESELAVNGGPKAVQGFTGRAEPKVGVEEFLELADTWGWRTRTRSDVMFRPMVLWSLTFLFSGSMRCSLILLATDFLLPSSDRTPLPGIGIFRGTVEAIRKLFSEKSIR